jgi:putative N6-adenine-specific DNA methylase
MAELRVSIEKDQVSVLLDISGEPLFKRGYRNEGGIAPLRETTAVTMLFLANWRRKFPLYDPFCGSGTIAIEAALYAWNIAPGLRRSFALSDLLIGNKELEQTVRETFLKQVDFSRTVRIFGSDVDQQVISLAKANVTRALALAGPNAQTEADTQAPDFRVLPMEKTRAPYQEGFIITNPPYGKRLGDTAAAELIYHDMSTLAQRFPGWKLGLITDHPGFESFLGRKADSCKELTNGVIPTYFFQYEHL